MHGWLSMALTGDLVAHHLEKATADLLVLDPTFKVEVAMIEELVGGGSGTRMIDAILRCLPSDATHYEPEASAQRLHALVSSPGFCISARACQEKVKVAQTLVNTLVEGRCPDFSATNGTALHAVRARFHFFLKVGGPSGSQAKLVNGADAVAPMLVDVAAKVDGGTATMTDLLPLHQFAWLFDQKQKQTAEKLCKDVADRFKNDFGESLRKRQRVKAPHSATTEVDKAMKESLDMFQ